jgi:deazaflavin-dependent oxidoreductase (nitroreductase family)
VSPGVRVYRCGCNYHQSAGLIPDDTSAARRSGRTENTSTMDSTIHDALDHSQTVDITTIGRHTGRPRRIEIALHNLRGRLVISGMPSPRTRAWIYNLEADPRLTVHLKGARVHADLEGTARVVTDPEERRAYLVDVARAWGRTDLDRMVAQSPLIEVTIPGYGVAETSESAVAPVPSAS